MCWQLSVFLILLCAKFDKRKSTSSKTGEAAVVKVVESQAQLYELDHDNDKPNLSELLSAGMITKKASHGLWWLLWPE